MSDLTNEQLVVLTTFDNAGQAHILKGRLEADGIDAAIFDENTISLNPLFNNALGGIKIMVRESDLAEAIAILNETEQAPYLSEDDVIIHCPHCNSTDIEGNYKSYKGIKGFFSVLISFLTFTYPLYYQNSYRCNNCGKVFEN